jgi:hypothetical protein
VSTTRLLHLKNVFLFAYTKRGHLTAIDKKKKTVKNLRGKIRSMLDSRVVCLWEIVFHKMDISVATYDPDMDV